MIKIKGKCLLLIYGGFGGNSNRFKTIKACKNTREGNDIAITTIQMGVQFCDICTYIPIYPKRYFADSMFRLEMQGRLCSYLQPGKWFGWENIPTNVI